MLNWYEKSKKIATSEMSIKDIEEISQSKWIPVESSFITDVAYYEPLGMFEIKLKDGHEYSYAGIPKDIFDEFMGSESKGRFYSKVIKPIYKLIRN